MNESAKKPKTMDFKNFIAMHGTICAFYLGHVPHPETNKPEYNLPAVQETIALLEMLSEKTKGNLDEEESKLLSDTIYALQMGYVNAVRAGAPTEPPQRDKREESPIATPKPKIYTPYDL